MITYKIHLIRHGLTQGNLEGWWVGRKDLPVCPEGFSRMVKLKENCQYPQVEAVYSSPLMRCRQTAHFFYPDQEPTFIENLQEMDFGDYEGKTIEELSQDPQFLEWMKNSMEHSPPNGENSIAFAGRIADGLGQVFTDMMARRITEAAVFTHGGVIMTLLAAYGFPREQMGRWAADNCCGYTIRMTPQMWQRDGVFEIVDLVPYDPAAREEPHEEDDLDWDDDLTDETEL